MIKVKEAIIVEGKYDKIKLSSLVDGLILETHGFQIFKDPKKMALLRRLADTRGLVVLTDSDAAGFVIRNYLNGSIDSTKIKHAYIPDVFGKEKRKEKASKEGKLGVEGVDASLILTALRTAGVSMEDDSAEASKTVSCGQPVSKADLYGWGLSGQEDSAQKRKILLQHLNLPEHLTTNALGKVLGSILSREQCQTLIEQLFPKK